MAAYNSQIQNFYSLSDASTNQLKDIYWNKVFDKNFFSDPPKGLNPYVLKTEVVQPPQTSFGFGQTVSWILPKQGDILEHFDLELGISALSAGTGGTFEQLVPGAHNWIQTIRILAGGTLLQEIASPVPLMIRRAYDDQTKFQTKLLSEGLYDQFDVAGASVNRSNLSNGAQNYYIEIQSLFDQCNVPVFALAQDIRVEITFLPLAQLVQHDRTGGSITCTMNSCNLRCKYINTSPDIKNSMVAASKAGYTLQFSDTQQLSFQVAAGATSASYNISNVKGLVHAMMVLVRPVANINISATINPVSGASYPNYSVGTALSRWLVKADGTVVTGDVTNCSALNYKE